MNSRVRKATLEDISKICDLLQQLFSQEEEFTPNQELQERSLHAIFKEQNLGDIFVIEVNDKVIGVATLLYTISTALGGRVALLEDVIIDINFQNQGFGFKLLTHVMNFSEKNDIKRVTLLTDSDNIKAHNLYKKLGFNSSNMRVFRAMSKEEIC